MTTRSSLTLKPYMHTQKREDSQLSPSLRISLIYSGIIFILRPCRMPSRCKHTSGNKQIKRPLSAIAHSALEQTFVCYLSSLGRVAGESIRGMHLLLTCVDIAVRYLARTDNGATPGLGKRSSEGGYSRGNKSFERNGVYSHARMQESANSNT